MKLTIDIAGDKQIERELLRIGDYAGDARPVFLSIAKELYQIEEEQFSTQGARSGGWKALAASTSRAKAAAGLDPRILHATGALRDSLTGPGGDNKLLVTDSFMVFGSNLFYAAIHQKGGDVIPQRRPVELTEMDRRDIMKRLQRYILKGELI